MEIAMKLKTIIPITLLIVILCLGTLSSAAEFASKTIDVGIVVGNIDKAVKFYSEALGMKEVPGFEVPAGFAGDAGLTDGKPLVVRVMVLGDGPGATKLKLMQISGTSSRPGSNKFIHSQLGFSYLTIGIMDTNSAVARLEKAGVKPLAKSPIALPPPLPQNIFVTLIRDPDGNLIELVGPKK